jgi:hypothetical protein
MKFRRDDRGVTVQIGAVLLFGILIIALATAQVAVVPDENATTEFKHNLEAQQSMGELRNALLAAGRSGDPAAASISLGTTYQQRTFLINPPPAGGSLRTDGTGDPRVNVTIANAKADSQYENANEYWNGTTRTYDTGAIVYQPNYNEYREAPTTVYENTLVANVFGENRTLEQSGQTLIRGTRISLLTLNGTLQENGVIAKSVDAQPLSAYTNTVTVRSTASDPLWVNITSRLSADTWGNRVLAEQTTSNGGNVAEVVKISNETRNGVTYHRVGIQLAPGSYELRGSSVAVGAISERNKQPKPTYLVVTDGYEVVGNQSTGTMTVEVRDQFNNPVTGTTVSVETDGTYLRTFNDSGNQVNETMLKTDADGRAIVRYRAVNVTEGGASLNVSIGNQDYEKWNESGIGIDEFAFGGGGDGGGGGEVNPGSSGELIQTTVNEGDNKDSVELGFNNTIGSQVNITGARLNFFYSDKDTPTSANISDGGGTLYTLEIGGDYERFGTPIEILANGQDTLTLSFDDKVDKKDFFVLTLVYEVDGQTQRSTYFVGLK